jgi:LysM repeat protein
MSETRQAILGVLAAIISAAIILGSLAVSLVEGGARFAIAPTLTSTSAVIPTQLPGEPTFTPRPTPPPTATQVVPTPSNCNVPAGWISITIQPDDTLQSLAIAYGTTVAELQVANCLPINTIKSDTILFVPPLPPTATPVPPTGTPTPTETSVAPTRVRISCTPRYGWPQYQVRPNDTLYGLASILGVSVNTLQDANCMGSSILLRAWSYIYVPHLPPTPIPYLSPTPRPSSTATLPVPNNTPRPTAPPVPTATPPQPTAPAPTNTPLPTATTPVPPTDIVIPQPTSAPPTPVTQPTPTTETPTIFTPAL